MATTTKLITSSNILEVCTLDQSIDPFWFDREILYCQEIYLKNLLTEELYYSFLDDYETLPLSAENQIIYDRYIKFIVCYGTAYRSVVGNIQTQAENQGLMENRTDYSNVAKENERRQAFFLYEKCFHYQKQLGNFLLNNTVDYPDFDATKIVLYPEFTYFNF